MRWDLFGSPPLRRILQGCCALLFAGVLLAWARS